MSDFNTATTAETKDEWLTPPELLKALGVFDLDPCSPPPLRRPWPTALAHYSLPVDGLQMIWWGRVWCNPPYGKETFKWLAKLAEHGRGIALIFARTETKGFHREIWEKAHAVFFFEGRIRFYHSSGIKGDMPNAPSCLVAYGAPEIEAIARAVEEKQIKGKLIRLIQ